MGFKVARVHFKRSFEVEENSIKVGSNCDRAEQQRVSIGWHWASGQNWHRGPRGTGDEGFYADDQGSVGNSWPHVKWIYYLA